MLNHKVNITSSNVTLFVDRLRDTMKSASRITIVAATAAIGLSATAIALHDYSSDRLTTVRAAVSEGVLPSTAPKAAKMIVADNTKKYEN